AVRGGNDITAVYMKIAHSGARQVQLQRPPVRAIVGRIPDAVFGTDVEKPSPNGILANHACIGAGGNAPIDPGPTPTIVRGFPEIRTQVVELIAIGGDIR